MFGGCVLIGREKRFQVFGRLVQPFSYKMFCGAQVVISARSVAVGGPRDTDTRNDNVFHVSVFDVSCLALVYYYDMFYWECDLVVGQLCGLQRSKLELGPWVLGLHVVSVICDLEE